MDLVAAGREDEEFLLDLLNTTPVVEGERVDELAQHKAARAPRCGRRSPCHLAR